MCVLSDYGVSGASPSSVQTSGTSAVYFSRLIGTGGVFGAVPSKPSATNATGQLLFSGSQYFAMTNGQRLRVVAAGTIFSAVSQTATVTVQINTGTVSIPSYTGFMTTGAQTINGRASWFLESHLTIGGITTQSAGYQSSQITQGTLSGFYFGAINGVDLIDFTAVPATSNPVIFAGPPPSFNTSGLVANVAFGTGNAFDQATLNQFQILTD